MKILFFSQSSAIYGGVERWLADLCTGLACKGWNIVLAFADGPTFHKASTYLSAYPELAALQHLILRSPSGLTSGRRRLLEKVIIDYQPDIVIPVLLHETLGAVAKCRAAGQQLKLVYPLHENEVWAFNAVIDNIPHIDAVVSVNRLMLDAIKQFSDWPIERSFHIPSGVNVPVRIAEPFRTSKPVCIGYCGKLVQSQKRVLDLVEFCQRMDAQAWSYQLTIAGEGAEEQALRLALASQLAAGRVCFLGRLSKETLYREFYPELDVLLITSEWETGPLVAWEAMLHGVLVLSSNYRGLRREGLFHHNENALVFPLGRPVEGAEALCALLDNREKLRQMADRGKRLAEESLTIEKMVECWSTALEKILAFPDQFAANVPPYDYRVPLREKLEDGIRSLLNRPFFAENAHQEWPRYKAGAVPTEVRDSFVRRLDELEYQLCGDLEAELDSPSCNIPKNQRLS